MGGGAMKHKFEIIIEVESEPEWSLGGKVASKEDVQEFLQDCIAPAHGAYDVRRDFLNVEINEVQ